MIVSLSEENDFRLLNLLVVNSLCDFYMTWNRTPFTKDKFLVDH